MATTSASAKIAQGYGNDKLPFDTARVKSINEIRRDNLLLLVKEAGSAARLSLLTGVPAPYISQVSRGVAHSNKGGRPRVMGDDVARRLEQKMSKPHAWMDADHSALSITTDLNGREGQLIGLFRLLAETEQADLVNDLTRKLRRGPPDHPGASADPGHRRH